MFMGDELMTQDVVNAVKEAKEQSKPRNMSTSQKIGLMRKLLFLTAVAKMLKSESLLMGNSLFKLKMLVLTL